MNQTSRPAVAVAALALSAAPILYAVPATADTSGTKAGVEYAERQAVGDGPSKAQIEQREREQLSTGGGSSTQQQSPSSPSSSGDTGAAAWQLALSAALGAALTGGVVMAARQATQHRHAVAS